MTHKANQHRFVANFVDAVTTRPMMRDLLRMRQESYRMLPRKMAALHDREQQREAA